MGAGKSLMNDISRFGGIYHMQQGLVGNLSNVIVRNYGKVDISVASKSYSVHNYAAV